MLMSSMSDESEESTEVVSLTEIYFLAFSIFIDVKLFYPSSLMLLHTDLLERVIGEVGFTVLNLRNGLSIFLFVSITLSGFRLT